MSQENSDQKTAAQQARAEAEAQINSEMVYQGKKVSVRVDHIILKSGHKYSREIVVHTGAVVMLPVDAEGKIILVKQWRRAANEVLLELPAGTLEKDEDPQECAQRELQEEIGFRANKITPLGGFFSAPGFSTEYLYLYLAEDLVESRLDPDENEQIEIIHLSPDEALKLVEQGEIRDAKSVAGICRYGLRLKQG